jgi:arylsulfatase
VNVQPQRGEERRPLPFRFRGGAPETIRARIASLWLAVATLRRTTHAGARRTASIAALAPLLGCFGCTAAPPPLALVLLITADTLRADHLGAYGSDRDLTPNLDKLARESLVFSNAYATAPFTLPSIASLMTGRYPEDLGIWSNESRIPLETSTLATALREGGWRTRAVVGNWILRGESGLSTGFEVYDDAFPQRESTRGLPERIAEDLTDGLLRVLAECTAGESPRCFLWGHFQDPHGPYTPPGDLRDRYLPLERRRPGGTAQLPVRSDNRGYGGIPDYQFLGEQEVAFYKAGYDAEIRYMDREVGRLIDAVEHRGLLERSLIVFAADHGEALGEEDYWFAHGDRLMEPLVRVPLLIRMRGTSAGQRDDVVSLVDVHPTLLGRVTGASVPATSRGRDLLAPNAAHSNSEPYLTTLGQALQLRSGLVRGEFKYSVEERDGVWYGKLVRREREEVDLTPAAPQIALKMRRQLFDFRRELIRGAPAIQQPALSEADRDKLRALGYLEGD